MTMYYTLQPRHWLCNEGRNYREQTARRGTIKIEPGIQSQAEATGAFESQQVTKVRFSRDAFLYGLSWNLKVNLNTVSIDNRISICKVRCGSAKYTSLYFQHLLGVSRNY